MKHLNHKRTGAIVTTLFACALSVAHAAEQAPRSDVFKAVDVDQDGAVSQAELQAFDPVAAKEFARFDTDKDGKLTPQEFAELVKAIQSK